MPILCIVYLNYNSHSTNEIKNVRIFKLMFNHQDIRSSVFKKYKK